MTPTQFVTLLSPKQSTNSWEWLVLKWFKEKSLKFLPGYEAGSVLRVTDGLKETSRYGVPQTFNLKSRNIQ